MSKGGKPVEYQITLTENQLRVAQRALEWFFRLQLGQFSDFADEIALDGYVFDKDNPNNGELFRRYITRRNDCVPLMETAYRIAQPEPCWKTEDMMVAEDMWAVIRHFRWKDQDHPKNLYTPDSRPPFIESKEPPITINKKESRGNE